MILFGGVENDSYLDDIYILDIESLQWTKGTPGGPAVARKRASCAVTNDLFVAWGGASVFPGPGVLPVSQNITIVYNLKTNQWQDTYSPDPYVPLTPPPAITSPSNSGAGTGSGSNPTDTSAGADSGTTSGTEFSIRLIIGGAVGGLAVIGGA
ncbi:hypothetical protein BGX24_006510, partial [Mortierella sp. AD032]